jgi:TolB-like protein
MKRRWFLGAGIIISLGLFFSNPSWAGQVVTKGIKAWAQKAIEEEKALKPPAARNTVAVLYFRNQTEQSELDPLQKGITLMLITDLTKIKSLQVVERVQLQALVEELGLGTSGLVEPNTAPRVGRILRARWLVGGEILTGKTVQEMKQLLLRSNLLAVPDQKIIGQPMAEGDLAELFRLEKELLFDLIKLIQVKITSQEEAELRKPCSMNLRALLTLFKAIDASDRGNYARAGDLYEMALREDGSICLASEALQELKALGLITAKKKSSEMLRSLRDETSLTNQLTPKDADKRIKTPKDVPNPVDIGIVFP